MRKRVKSSQGSHEVNPLNGTELTRMRSETGNKNASSASAAKKWGILDATVLLTKAGIRGHYPVQ